MIRSIANSSLVALAIAGLAAPPGAAQTPVLDIENATGDSILHLNADGGLLIRGGFDTGQGIIPYEGAGARLLWYPEKAAFRAGRVVNDSWDDARIGEHSVAMGYNTVASGDYAVAFGSSNKASGFRSTAMGDGARATGDVTTAIGRGTTAQAYESFVVGRFNVVEGDPSSWVDSDPLFVVGNGRVSRSNALTLYKNGDLTIAGSLTESSDIRLKEDVEPLGGTLARVLKLTPIRYRFREGTGHPTDRQIGLSAQQVESVFPELVHRDGRGYLSVAYADLSAVLIGAIQEQDGIMNELRDEIDALRSELGGLRGENDELAERVRRLEAVIERLPIDGDPR